MLEHQAVWPVAWVRTKALIRKGGEQCTRGGLSPLTNQVAGHSAFLLRASDCQTAAVLVVAAHFSPGARSKWGAFAMQVKRVFENGDVLVSTRDFRRFVDQPWNRVSMDFVPAEWADEVPKTFNDRVHDGSQWCEVWTYKESAGRGHKSAGRKINRPTPATGKAKRPIGQKMRKTPRKSRGFKPRIAKVA